MRHGFRVMDSDIHVMEPGDLYLKYMDPKWGDAIPRARGPRPASGIHTFTRADGARVRTLAPENRDRPDLVRGAPGPMADPRFTEALARDYDAPSMLQAMDMEGVDISVLFRTQPIFADQDMDPEYAFAIARAWNDWVTDYASADPKRLKCASQIPTHDVAMAVQEARRAVTKLGHIGLCVHPEPMHGRQLHDPWFDPLWAEAQDLDVPVCFHPTAGANVQAVGNRYLALDPKYLWGAVTQPLEDILALVSMCGGGVLERFPRLRVAFLEGNCGWLPWLLYRLDERFELSHHRAYQGHRDSVRMERRPSQCFLEQCFCSLDADEELGTDVMRRLGDDFLVFSTDWPHGDAKYPHATETLLAMEGLSEGTKRKVLWDNTARLYGQTR